MGPNLNPPSTPTRASATIQSAVNTPPPFTPRKILVLPETPQISRLDDLATGCCLLIRGVAAHTTMTTVEIVQRALASLATNDPVLSASPIRVNPFNPKRPGDWSASCYVSLVNEMGSDGEPRSDLLDEWKAKILAAHPEWEVVWQPTTEGTDKRLWVRFPTLKDGANVEALPEIRKWLTSRNVKYTSEFTGPGGTTFNFAYPKDVEDFFDHTKRNNSLDITIPAKKDRNGTVVPAETLRLPVARGIQIEIENAFEIVVSNIDPGYSGLTDAFAHYLASTFKTNEGESLLAGIRSVSGSLIFYFTSWTATAQVLKYPALIVEYFNSQIGKPVRGPLLLFHHNRNAIWKKDPTLAAVEGASKGVGAGVEEVIRKLEAIDKKHDRAYQELNIRLDTGMKAIQEFGQAVATINARMAASNQLAAAQSMLNTIAISLMDVRNMIMNTRMSAAAEKDKDQLESYNVQLGLLKEREQELTKDRDEATKMVNALSAPPGPALPLAPPLAIASQPSDGHQLQPQTSMETTSMMASNGAVDDVQMAAS